jgi:AraC-like DNA-binding protein
MALIDPDAAQRDVFVLAEHYDAGPGHWHAHRRAQLIHASVGVLQVHSDAGQWVVPPQRAVWVPPQVRHRVSSSRAFWLRTLYAEPQCVAVPDQCTVVSVDLLVDELLRAAARFGPDYPQAGSEARVIAVILDRVPHLVRAPLHLPRPSDPRLARIADTLLADPADATTLNQWAEQVGATARTIARLFLKDTGLSFAQWRQQRRLLAALERLGAGHSVTNVALDVGYADVSSFVAVFKEALGETPARYFRDLPNGLDLKRARRQLR